MVAIEGCYLLGCDSGLVDHRHFKVEYTISIFRVQ
jgi:hypothetical protein